MTALRQLVAPRDVVTGLVLAAGLSVAGLLLWPTSVPDGFHRASLAAADFFGEPYLRRADHFENVLRWTWVGRTVTLLLVFAIYARKGAAFVRESAAGPIGTGMLLAMLGFALLWLVQVPFDVIETWWQRRYDVSHEGYWEVILGGWLGLGVTFLALCLGTLVIMGIAGRLRTWWWLPAAAVFAGIQILLLLAFPYLQPDTHPIRSPALRADVRQLQAAVGVSGVDTQVQDVSTYTDLANAFAIGVGPTRKVFLWDTLLRAPFDREEVRIVLAHEYAHHKDAHLWKGVAWYGIFAALVAFVSSIVTRRRGGLARPESIPVALLVFTVVGVVATPFQTLVTRRLETEADWSALQATRDPVAMTGLFRDFAKTGLGDPDPPGWAYVLLEDHPTLLQRIELARAWQERYGATRKPLPLPAP